MAKRNPFGKIKKTAEGGEHVKMETAKEVMQSNHMVNTIYLDQGKRIAPKAGRVGQSDIMQKSASIPFRHNQSEGENFSEDK